MKVKFKFGGKLGKLRMIHHVDASNFPSDVDDYLVEKEIGTHCEDQIIIVEDDGNPLAEWLKKEGIGDYTATYEWLDEPGWHLAISGT